MKLFVPLVHILHNETKQSRLWFGPTGLDGYLCFCGERSVDGFSRASSKKGLITIVWLL